jgi:hypothetical protein
MARGSAYAFDQTSLHARVAWETMITLLQFVSRFWADIGQCESYKRRNQGLTWKQRGEHSGFEPSLLRIFDYLDHWGFTWKHWNAFYLWVASDEGLWRWDFPNRQGRYCTGVLNLFIMSTSGLSLTFALTLSSSMREKEHTQDLLGTRLLPHYLYCYLHQQILTIYFFNLTNTTTLLHSTMATS